MNKTYNAANIQLFSIQNEKGGIPAAIGKTKSKNKTMILQKYEKKSSIHNAVVDIYQQNLGNTAAPRQRLANPVHATPMK